MLSPGGRHLLERLRFKLVRSAYERRDVWPDKDHALISLKNSTESWDPRMVRLFVVSIAISTYVPVPSTHALRPELWTPRTSWVKVRGYAVQGRHVVLHPR